MLEKDIRILYVRPYDFINEKNGENVKGAKCSYCFTEPIDKDNEKGYKVSFGNLPYNTAKEIMNNLIYECIGVFDITSNNELKLVDIKNKK